MDKWLFRAGACDAIRIQICQKTHAMGSSPKLAGVAFSWKEAIQAVNNYDADVWRTRA